MKKNPKDIPYVLVQHNDSGKAFALSRGYRLMSADVPTTVKLWMINNQEQSDEGWFPTNEDQSPLGKAICCGRFYRYWIDYSKHYQKLVVNG